MPELLSHLAEQYVAIESIGNQAILFGIDDPEFADRVQNMNETPLSDEELQTLFEIVQTLLREDLKKGNLTSCTISLVNTTMLIATVEMQSSNDESDIEV